MLDGSIHDGIITHAVYVVTVTEENFKRTGDQMFAVSSQEKLRVRLQETEELRDVLAACIPMPGVLLNQSVSSEKYEL